MAFDFKNGSPADRKKECDRIEKEVGKLQMFSKSELKRLPDALSNNEQVLSFVSGVINSCIWLCVLTDKRIILLGRSKNSQPEQITIDLDKINSVVGKQGILFHGKITIQDNASATTITRVRKASVFPFANKVRDAIEQRKTSAQAPQQIYTASAAEQLEKLVALKAQGVLSEEEFQAEKAKVLK